MVAAGYIIGTLGGGIYFYGFTVFFLPVSRDLGLSYALTSLVMSQARAEGAFLGPLAGWLINRFGSRTMLLIGTALAGVGYLLLATAQGFVSFLVIYLLVISLGFNLGFFSALMAAVNHWFVRRRGMAMSILMSSVGAGGAFIVPRLSAVVGGGGWRTGAVLSGVVLLAVGLPASLLVRHSPESMGLQPDGRPAPPPGEGDHSPDPELSARQALRTRAFWLLTAAVTLRVGVFGALVLHLVPILVWRGLDPQMAANTVGVLALLSIATRIGLGWVGDRLGKVRVISVAVLVGAFSVVLLALGTQLWHYFLFAAAFAVADGASPLGWALIGDFFGRKSFAT
ncbi:MAG: MFS transporter, partial [Dehalococcoidia bacterium]